MEPTEQPPVQADEPFNPVTGATQSADVADQGAAVETMSPEPVPAPAPVEQPVEAERATFVPDPAHVSAVQAQPVQSASNVTASLPANAQAAAAHAHAFFTHLIKMAEAARSDIEKYVPASFVQTAEHEVAQFIKAII